MVIWVELSICVGVGYIRVECGVLGGGLIGVIRET